MKLAEALRISNQPASGTRKPFHLFLACGFNALHLETYLAAYLRSSDPGRPVRVRTGPYGDLPGSLGRFLEETPDAGAVVIEWPDLDPRLGLRSLGGWEPGDLDDIRATVDARLAIVQDALGRAAGRTGLAVCLPTLPLPPVSYTPGWQASPFDLEVRSLLSAFAARIAGIEGIRVVNPQRLDELSPPGDRHDVKAELFSGFPYKTAHAAVVADLLARLIGDRVPKKGLITDLDDTLWGGLVGEVGAEGVSWDLEHRSQVHGLYQQTLSSLARTGVLVAVASKNDEARVREVFRREDLVLKREHVYPFEVHWSPKSESVGRILRRWNIGADSVVFVDDSPLELAEVEAAFPGIECLRFEGRDERSVRDLLVRLRDLFGKDRISEEDAIRARSLRLSGARGEARRPAGDDYGQFLRGTEAVLTVGFAKAPLDPRALELVNKTNQFNLNGRRFTEGEWRDHLAGPDTFLLMASYRDKYGPLGKVAVLSGRAGGAVPVVETWVMSCRAFSRHIEYTCLSILFRKFGAAEVGLDFRPTPKNGPLQEFLAKLAGGAGDPVRIARGEFESKCPPPSHAIEGFPDA